MLRPSLVLALASSLSAQASWFSRPASPLTPRQHAAFAYDEARHVSVLYGGGGNTDTWEYNGASWVQRSGAGGPTFFPDPTRHALAATYNSNSDKVILTNSWGFDTYEFTGTSWTLINSNLALSNRIFYSLAFDPVRNQVVMFGGTYQNNNVGLPETWTFSGGTWTQAPVASPPARFRAAMAFDAARGVMVMFGGQSNVNGVGVVYSDTWEWDGTTWRRRLSADGNLSGRAGALAAYDSARGRVVLVGGDNNVTGQDDTWEWDGVTWHLIATTIAPPASISVPMVYDVNRGVAVMYQPAGTSDVWEYLPGTRATFTTYGQGCSGPNGMPQLTAGSGSRPRLGMNLVVNLTNLPSAPGGIAAGAIGFDGRSVSGAMVPVNLTAMGFTGCRLWTDPAIFTLLVSQGGSATWSTSIPLNVNLVGQSFFMQGAALASGWNPGGLVFTNAGDAAIGIQ